MNQEKSGICKGYFFDTYALIEIFQGKDSYEKYKTARFVTTFLNLYEFYYCLRKSYDKDAVRAAFEKLIPFCVRLRPDDIIEASEFRLKVRRELSYADCLGYVISLKFGIKFLTGDRQFQDLDNVE